LHIGRFEEVKNHTFLLDIFYEYKKCNPDAKLLLAGDGKLRQAMEQKAKKLDLQNDVMFLGVRTDTASLYSAADIVIMPSLFEGLPVVLVEAQANGIRCLVSDTIDREIELTKTISFFSLDVGAIHWAKEAAGLKLQHTDTQDNLLAGRYDMAKCIVDVDKIYAQVTNE
jgi:glycosyltransferase involved in cell wall biosynthesis